MLLPNYVYDSIFTEQIKERTKKNRVYLAGEADVGTRPRWVGKEPKNSQGTRVAQRCRRSDMVRRPISDATDF